jgi:hypothetical protein
MSYGYDRCAEKIQHWLNRSTTIWTAPEDERYLHRQGRTTPSTRMFARRCARGREGGCRCVDGEPRIYCPLGRDLNSSTNGRSCPILLKKSCSWTRCAIFDITRTNRSTIYCNDMPRHGNNLPNILPELAFFNRIAPFPSFPMGPLSPSAVGSPAGRRWVQVAAVVGLANDAVGLMRQAHRTSA